MLATVIFIIMFVKSPDKACGEKRIIDSSEARGSTEARSACGEDEFACQCRRNNPQTCSSRGRGCVPMSEYRDGKEDCEDGSDEREYFTRTKCGACDVTVRRLDSTEQCDGQSDCDKETCTVVPALNCTDNAKCNVTEVICTSHCDTLNASHFCDVIIQCDNGYLEIAHNFCDGKVDCPDGSDEIRNQPGFKCSTSFGRCVLPQRNLHDDVAQCKNELDLCSGHPCFECLDGKLNISRTQLCDGTIDCFDLSDECLCQAHFHKSVCQGLFILNNPSAMECGKVNPQCHDIEGTSIEIALCNNNSSFNLSNNVTSFLSIPSHIRCESKFGEITSVTCDGRPECKYFQDECSCDDVPSFCNSSCHHYYPHGDRYCDGIIDEAWMFINDSSCLEGFDEESCPQRFACKAGNLVSIDRAQICDKIVDCDDGSDEELCEEGLSSAGRKDFSSSTDMIASVPLRIIYWAMAVLIIIGNTFVVFSTTYLLFKKKIMESQKLNHIMILNLSFSDLLMGFYLLAVSIKSLQYSGYYDKFDYQWRTSLECSITGSLAIISSETSCFIMTIITAFRLYNVFNPLTARTASMLKWKLGIVLAWLVSLVLALLPIFKTTSSYFVHEVWFSTEFPSGEIWNKSEVMTFACRLASLSSHSLETNGDAWESTQIFLKKFFSEYSLKGEFGFYGETSICIPKIHENDRYNAWVFTLVMLTLNFVAFLFIAISYILIYFKTSHRPIQNSQSDKQSREMQQRIARLIATDFACWFPLCILVYLKTGGVDIPPNVHDVTAGLLLPINSALNPLLYSPMLGRRLKLVFFPKRRHSLQEMHLKNLY